MLRSPNSAVILNTEWKCRHPLSRMAIPLRSNPRHRTERRALALTRESRRADKPVSRFGVGLELAPHLLGLGAISLIRKTLLRELRIGRN